MRDFCAEALFDAREREFGVFDDVMEQRGSQRGGIEAQVREDVRDFEQMRQVRLTGAAYLVAMALGGNLVGAANHPGIFGGTILAEFFEQLFEAQRRAGARRDRDGSSEAGCRKTAWDSLTLNVLEEKRQERPGGRTLTRLSDRGAVRVTRGD